MIFLKINNFLNNFGLMSTVLSILSALQLLTVNPLIPMTAITGSPDRRDITEMLCDYHEVGIEQFLIYPRSGLDIEYMSDEWFRLCRDCIEVADSLGMKVWLYDEYNWPSGNCKGQVTAGGHEDCYPKVMWFDRRKDGRFDTSIALSRNLADLLDPKAVARFIELTHERYYREFGKYFGNVIPAIFTDEAVGYVTVPFNKDHFGLTWYDRLEEDYRLDSGGRDLRADVAGFLDGRPSGELWTSYYTVYGERMRRTYIEELSRWCESHGIKLTGHVMYEKLYKGVRCNGNTLKMLSSFGIPGFDEANSDIDIRALEMEVSGLALVQYASRGKEGAMCELYSVGPADLTLSHQRQLMWMCSAFGVNNYIVAVASMDARGNKEKGDWYFNSGRTQPWFDYYREFGREAKRAAAFARKPYSPDVMVRVPSRYFMSLDKTDAFEIEGKKYLRFLEALLAWQVQFMLLDEDEDAAGKPVLGFGPDGFYIEGGSTFYWDQDEYMSRVTEIAPRTVVVRDGTGAEVRDVLVRRYDDGCVTLVDLTDDDASDRLLSVRTPGGTGRVRLQGHGAFAGKLSQMRAVALPAGREFRGEPRIELKGVNLVRCMHLRDNPEFRFKVNDRLDGLRLLVRTEVDSVSVLLDGRPVALGTGPVALPEGFRQLYRASEPFELRRGNHTISFPEGDVDMRYLPSAFIAGDFAYDRAERVLSRWTGEGCRTEGVAPDFVGTYDVTYGMQLEPGETLCLNTNLACTEVLVDGNSLGRRAWGPFEWRIPADTEAGRHEVTVRISNSVMPMFGNVPALDRDQPYVDWLRIKPGQHGDKASTGVYGISVVSTRDLQVTVLDRQKNPVAGATVWEKGTRRGWVTDLNGTAAVSGVVAGTRLLVQSLGYLPKEVVVGKRGDITVVVDLDEKLKDVIIR